MLSSEEKLRIRKYCEKDRELSHLFEELETSHRMDVSMISHEIRNPVTIINSFLQLTETCHPEVRQYATWPHIIENMRYLRNLLADLSFYQNADALNRKEFSLPRMLQALTEDSLSLAAPCRLSFETSETIPPATLDETKIREAVLNLIRNAREALEGQPDGQIRIRLAFDGSDFLVSVADNGPVIPPADLKRIFDPFVTTKPEGTGLGLSIIRQITLAHHGQILVTSSPAETCFTLKFPRM